ncbi:terpene synthase family protein [Streptomyces sp. IBSNAI002]|uniref:terpene synthase family protein n=1 Tax=Streptomyces sp. IBSNAI002 TaxID=3457500 RepID=UPI003FD185E4
MDYSITLPFPDLIPTHPEVLALAEQQCSDWLVDVGGIPAEMLPGLRRQHLTDLAAGFCSGEENPNLFLMSLSLAVSNITDDYFDGEIGRNPERALEAIDEVLPLITFPPPRHSRATTPIADLTARFWAHLSQEAPRSWAGRAAGNLRAFLRAFPEEARLRAQHTIPSFPAYRELRRATVHMRHFSDTAERACGIELPGYLCSSRLFTELHECVSDVCGFINDVYSFEQEHARGDTCNLILVLARERRWSHAQAAREAIDMALAVCGLFEEAAGELLRFCRSPADGDVTQRYLALLRNEMKTTESWHHMSGRYDTSLS